MRILVIASISFFALHLAKADGTAKSKAAKSHHHGNPFAGVPKPRFISFNSDEGHIDIDWDVAIPVISIPLGNKHGGHGEAAPLFNINPKALGIAGLLTTIITLVVPLVTKSHSGSNYRSDENAHWSQMGNAINEMIFGNNYVTPCMQRVVCSVVSMARRSENPTSTEKIIDGVSSHKWFKNVTNGTIIHDAVTVGQEGHRDCSHIYKDCIITPRLVKNLLNEFGLI